MNYWDSSDESEQIRESMLYSLQVNLNSSIDAFDQNLSETVKILNFVADEIIENKSRSWISLQYLQKSDHKFGTKV